MLRTMTIDRSASLDVARAPRGEYAYFTCPECQQRCPSLINVRPHLWACSVCAGGLRAAEWRAKTAARDMSSAVEWQARFGYVPAYLAHVKL